MITSTTAGGMLPTWQRSIAAFSLAALLSALTALTACGGGEPPPAVPGAPVMPVMPVMPGAPPGEPVATITPTVAFIGPTADRYVTGSFALQVLVAGAPDRVELYQNAVFLGTLPPPYDFNWINDSLPDGAYAFTAKAIKAGLPDVLSDPRTLTLDRTAPTLVSRLPANGAANVQRSDEISITMSERVDPSSVNAANVRLLVGGAEVASSAVLDGSGRKIIVAFNAPPALPATVTLAVSGITDLAQNAAGSIADASFTMTAPAAATPTMKVTLLSDRWEKSTLGRTLGFHKVYVELNGFSPSFPYPSFDTFDLYFNDRIVDIFGLKPLEPGNPYACPTTSVCGEFEVSSITPYANDNYLVKVGFKLPDGSMFFSPTVPLTIAIPNGYFNSGLTQWTKVESPRDLGRLTIVAAPPLFTTPPPAGRQEFGFTPRFGDFLKIEGPPGGSVAVYRTRFPLAVPDTIGGEFSTNFRALIYNSNPGNGNRITGSMKACGPDPDSNGTRCTVSNTFSSDSQDYFFVGTGPPILPGAAYAELELRFDINGPIGTMSIGNMWFGY